MNEGKAPTISPDRKGCLFDRSVVVLVGDLLPTYFPSTPIRAVHPVDVGRHVMDFMPDKPLDMSTEELTFGTVLGGGREATTTVGPRIEPLDCGGNLSAADLEDVAITPRTALLVMANGKHVWAGIGRECHVRRVVEQSRWDRDKAQSWSSSRIPTGHRRSLRKQTRNQMSRLLVPVELEASCLARRAMFHRSRTPL